MNSVNLLKSSQAEHDEATTPINASHHSSSVKPQLTYVQHKAGMDNNNADEIARKIYEASKDSDHYKK